MPRLSGWPVLQSKHVAVCSDQATYLRTVGVERGLLVVCLDGLCVVFERSGPVVCFEGLIALVLELDGFFLGSHGASNFCARRRVCEARDGNGQARRLATETRKQKSQSREVSFQKSQGDAQ